MSSKKKRIYLSVIGVGALALLLDRLFLQGEDTVPAAAVADVQTAGVAGIEAAVDVPEDGIPMIPFPGNLPEPPDDISELVDFFESPAIRSGRADDPADQPAESARAREFEADHALTAVIVQGEMQMAVVDQKWIRLGQSLSGCTLDRVTGTMAIFTCFDGPATLKLTDRKE